MWRERGGERAGEREREGVKVTMEERKKTGSTALSHFLLLSAEGGRATFLIS